LLRYVARFTTVAFYAHTLLLRLRYVYRFYTFTLLFYVGCTRYVYTFGCTLLRYYVDCYVTVCYVAVCGLPFTHYAHLPVTVTFAVTHGWLDWFGYIWLRYHTGCWFTTVTHVRLRLYVHTARFTWFTLPVTRLPTVAVGYHTRSHVYTARYRYRLVTLGFTCVPVTRYTLPLVITVAYGLPHTRHVHVRTVGYVGWIYGYVCLRLRLRLRLLVDSHAFGLVTLHVPTLHVTLRSHGSTFTFTTFGSPHTVYTPATTLPRSPVTHVVTARYRYVTVTLRSLRCYVALITVVVRTLVPAFVAFTFCSHVTLRCYTFTVAGCCVVTFTLRCVYARLVVTRYVTVPTHTRGYGLPLRVTFTFRLLYVCWLRLHVHGRSRLRTVTRTFCLVAVVTCLVLRWLLRLFTFTAFTFTVLRSTHVAVTHVYTRLHVAVWLLHTRYRLVGLVAFGRFYAVVRLRCGYVYVYTFYPFTRYVLPVTVVWLRLHTRSGSHAFAHTFYVAGRYGFTLFYGLRLRYVHGCILGWFTLHLPVVTVLLRTLVTVRLRYVPTHFTRWFTPYVG